MAPSVAKVPAEQASHAVPSVLGTVPAGQVSWPVAVQMLPAGQVIHCSAPLLLYSLLPQFTSSPLGHSLPELHSSQEDPSEVGLVPA